MICTCTVSPKEFVWLDNKCPVHATKSSANKQTLYYVLKYQGKYYAPYLKADNDYRDLDKMLTSDRHLAVRFPTKQVAEYMANLDAQYRMFLGYAQSNFEPFKVKVVRVFKKISVV